MRARVRNSEGSLLLILMPKVGQKTKLGAGYSHNSTHRKGMCIKQRFILGATIDSDIPHIARSCRWHVTITSRDL